jgi:DNA-directed RNA polymerase subunit H (RpoH/RPB5)
MHEKFSYAHYLNVRKAFTNREYRGLETEDGEMKYEEFSKLLLAQKYVMVKCKYPSNFRREEYRGRTAFVVYTRHDSEFHNRSKELITLLDKISALVGDKSVTSDLFLITKDLLKKRTMKKVREYKHFNFCNIPSVRFAIELPKANLCNKHTIVSVDEIKNLSEECYLVIDRQKNLSEDDPQNVWIGGFPGELVHIERPSLMAGYADDYRYVMGVIPRVSESSNADDDDEGDEVDEKTVEE